MFDRARLKPANVVILTSLHVWETFDLEEDKGSRKWRIANDDLFKIVLALETIDDYEDDEDFLKR